MPLPAPKVDVKDVLGRVVSYLDVAVHPKEHQALVQDVNTMKTEYSVLQQELVVVTNERDSLKRKADSVDADREVADQRRRRIAALNETNNELRYLNKHAAENASRITDVLAAERVELNRSRAQFSALSHEFNKLDSEHRALRVKQQVWTTEHSEIKLAAALEQVKVAEFAANQARASAKDAEGRVQALTIAFPLELAEASEAIRNQIGAQVKTACEIEAERMLNQLQACFEQESRARAEELTRKFLEERGCSVSDDGTLTFPIISAATGQATQIKYVDRVHVETVNQPCTHCEGYREIIAKLKQKLSVERVRTEQSERDHLITRMAHTKATAAHKNQNSSLDNHHYMSGGRNGKTNQGSRRR